MRPNPLIISLTVGLLISLSLNAYQYTNTDRSKTNLNSNSTERLPDEEDRRYIERAVAHWARKTNATVERARLERQGKVMYFPNEACVSLEMELGGAGGTPIYCFSLQGGQLTRRYDDVE